MHNHNTAEPSDESPTKGLHRVVFLLEPDCPRSAVEVAAELFATANALLERDFYSVQFLHGLDSLRSLNSADRNQTLILFGQNGERWQTEQDIGVLLRSKLPCFHRLGLVGGAVFLLQDLPGLKGREVTVHPKLEFAARESRISVCSEPSPIWQDGNVYSAFSGIAAMHMILSLITADLGAFLAQSVAAEVGLTLEGRARHLCLSSWYIREAEGCSIVVRGLEMMQENVENPFPGRKLAEAVAVSPRTLERSFRTKLGQSPMTVYRNIRLDRAHQLLGQTDLSLMEVCVASGFSSKSNFVHWYRERYGQNPAQARKLRYSGTAA